MQKHLLLTVTNVDVNKDSGSIIVYFRLEAETPGGRIVLGVNKYTFNDAWAGVMINAIRSLVQPRLEQMFLDWGLSVNGIIEEEEAWQAIEPMFSKAIGAT